MTEREELVNVTARRIAEGLRDPGTPRGEAILRRYLRRLLKLDDRRREKESA